MLARAPEGYTQFEPVPYLMPYFIHAAGVLQLHLLETLPGLGAASSQVRETTLEMRYVYFVSVEKIMIESMLTAVGDWSVRRLGIWTRLLSGPSLAPWLARS